MLNSVQMKINIIIVCQMIAMVARNSKTVIVLISSVNLSPLLLPAGIALISENIVMAYIIYTWEGTNVS